MASKREKFLVFDHLHFSTSKSAPCWSIACGDVCTAHICALMWGYLIMVCATHLSAWKFALCLLKYIHVAALSANIIHGKCLSIGKWVKNEIIRSLCNHYAKQAHERRLNAWRQGDGDKSTLVDSKTWTLQLFNSDTEVKTKNEQCVNIAAKLAVYEAGYNFDC